MSTFVMQGPAENLDKALQVIKEHGLHVSGTLTTDETNEKLSLLKVNEFKSGELQKRHIPYYKQTIDTLSAMANESGLKLRDFLKREVTQHGAYVSVFKDGKQSCRPVFVNLENLKRSKSICATQAMFNDVEKCVVGVKVPVIVFDKTSYSLCFIESTTNEDLKSKDLVGLLETE
jgi:hypothetical protein